MIASVLADVALAISASIAVAIVCKATVLLALALASTRLARRARASLRHVLLASVFGALLALPVAAVFAPPLTIGIARPEPIVAMSRPSVGSDDTPASDITQVGPLAPVNARGSRPLRVTQTLLAAVWASGATLVLLSFVAGSWQLQRARRGSVAWVEGEAMVNHLAAAAGIHRPVEALLHHTLPAPMTWGFAHPAVVLPADIHTWTDRDVRHAVIHELEHVRRGDWLVQVVAGTVCAVYWFHPFVWTMWRQLRLEADRACDDAVLAGADRTVYAQQLVTLARRLSGHGARPILEMARRTDLSKRVAAVLDGAQPRGRAGALRVTAIVTAAVMLLTAISPLRAMPLLGRSATSPAQTGEFEVASIERNTSDDGRVARDPHARISTNAGGICASWGWIRTTETCFWASNLTLRELIAYAFGPSGLVPPQPSIFDGPTWIDSDHFNVVARATGNPPLEPFGSRQLAMMVRALLAQRFKLRLHHEHRSLPVYELVLARRDRTLGPRLRPASTDCLVQVQALRAVLADGRLPHLPSPHPCISESGPGYLKGAFDMAQLVWALSNRLNRVVRDRTELTGMFEMDLTWPLVGVPAIPRGEPRLRPINPTAAIFIALQEQLGLTLEATTGVVDVLVVDGASPPGPD